MRDNFTTSVNSRSNAFGNGERLQILGDVERQSIAFERRDDEVTIEVSNQEKILMEISIHPRMLHQFASLLDILLNNIRLHQKTMEEFREHSLRIATIKKWSPKG